MAIEDFYVECTRKRPTHTINDYGETVKTYTDTTINGYYNGQPSNTQVFMGGKWVIQSQLTFLTDDSDIQHDDIVVIESDNFRVIGRRADGGNKGHHYEVLVERVDSID
jgi:hypothetical protein